ncbi:MAG: hypothetical protein AB1898_12670 [Acidobacteriota bacterium]
MGHWVRSGAKTQYVQAALGRIAGFRQSSDMSEVCRKVSELLFVSFRPTSDKPAEGTESSKVLTVGLLQDEGFDELGDFVLLAPREFGGRFKDLLEFACRASAPLAGPATGSPTNPGQVSTLDILLEACSEAALCSFP